MTKHTERTKETRERLLASAAACFAEKGYSECSVADIVKRAGMSQGSLYVHFNNKEELFKSMIEEEHRQGAEKARVMSERAPFLQRIIEIMSDCIRDVGFPIDHRLWTEILAIAARDESIRSTFMASDKAMRTVFIELLQKAADGGEIDNSLDFDAVSIWLYAIVDGLIARTADDVDFNFYNYIETFKILICRALRQ
jgi:AcrR family transcriptional regulator